MELVFEHVFSWFAGVSSGRTHVSSRGKEGGTPVGRPAARDWQVSRPRGRRGQWAASRRPPPESRPPTGVCARVRGWHGACPGAPAAAVAAAGSHSSPLCGSIRLAPLAHTCTHTQRSRTSQSQWDRAA